MKGHLQVAYPFFAAALDEWAKHQPEATVTAIPSRVPCKLRMKNALPCARAQVFASAMEAAGFLNVRITTADYRVTIDKKRFVCPRAAPPRLAHAALRFMPRERMHRHVKWSRRTAGPPKAAPNAVKVPRVAGRCRCGRVWLWGAVLGGTVSALESFGVPYGAQLVQNDLQQILVDVFVLH